MTPAPATSSALGTYVPLSTRFSNTVCVTSHHSVRDTAVKVTFTFIFLFLHFWIRKRKTKYSDPNVSKQFLKFIFPYFPRESNSDIKLGSPGIRRVTC